MFEIAHESCPPTASFHFRHWTTVLKVSPLHYCERFPLAFYHHAAYKHARTRCSSGSKKIPLFDADDKPQRGHCAHWTVRPPALASKQTPYHPSPTGELSDRSNRELNVSKLLTAMSTLRMDFGLTEDGVLDISDRDGVLLALHLFQVMSGFRSLGDWRHYI